MRTTLANIPKHYIPIEKGEVRKSVRKMIVAGLSRSAAIAYESKPRVGGARLATADTQEERVDGDGEKNPDMQGRARTFKIFRMKKAPTAEERMGITLPPHKAVWGEIEHYGWASPNSPDLPNLQYSTVISELPNLIEAKALTLAPLAPESEPAQPVLDPEAIALLQRPENLPLRQYLAQLAELGVLAPSRATADFLSSYDYARYSTRPISNTRFRELMHLFAEILRTMEPLDPETLRALNGANDDVVSSESDIDNDAPRESPSTPRSRISQPSLRRQQSNASHATASTSSSSPSGASQIRRRPDMTVRHSSQGTWAGTYRTAPTTPKSRRTAVSPVSVSNSSLNSFAQTRHPYVAGGISGSSSSASLRSAGSGGSIIRLSEAVGAGELPYVLTLAETGQ
ncbi:hypothetical protein M406DRAFT_322409 [Cryphonectria parasitica EP155]|uniref:Defect at low temperature protein 1 n=1 Tax=Cryphonectria parasitica (strain ATCC 38755 / EP155) TaxID=660469 RepID=A0A9P4Y3Y7_CRYP1|nr:uncharacterized protein M406DRAFT_322409 [Cryphonectria parasitica EP155]KAF3766507.1 hypothetical protein M406DRAFT_322409 [Cryphonectria parasitica EP155]